MDNNMIKYFWSCGDDQIIQFALIRAHLNRRESQVLLMTLDECMSQEEIAEELGYSVRRVQQFWTSATAKLLSIPWVIAFAEALARE